jgi:hypothetical protein
MFLSQSHENPKDTIKLNYMTVALNSLLLFGCRLQLSDPRRTLKECQGTGIHANE